jgi:hypothetical protein
VKRIPPSAIGLDLTHVQYIPALAPSGTFFFTITLLESLGKLIMLTKGGMRFAFPSYVLIKNLFQRIRKHVGSLFFKA